MFNDQDLEIEMCSPKDMTAEEWRKLAGNMNLTMVLDTT